MSTETLSSPSSLHTVGSFPFRGGMKLHDSEVEEKDNSSITPLSVLCSSSRL